MTTLLYPSPDATTFIDILVWMNSVTLGYFWVLTCLALFCILFFSLKNYSTSKAITTSAFVTAIYTILLRMAGLVNTKYMVFFIVVSAASVIYLALSNETES
jgi:heme A synthase